MALCIFLFLYIFQAFGVRTRSRAVSIFNICAGMIATMAELQKASMIVCNFLLESYPQHLRIGYVF